MYGSTRKLEGKYFIEKIVCVLFFFRKDPKSFGLLAKLFRQGGENCFWCVHNINMRKFSRKKVRYFLALSHTEQTRFGFQLKISCRGCLKTLNYFLINSGHWAKNFLSSDEKKLQGCQNWFLRVYRNSLNEKNSWKNVLSFFFFGHWAKKFWLFIIFLRWSCQKCILRVQGNTSTKNVFQKVIYDFNFFSDYDWEKFGFPASFFLQV